MTALRCENLADIRLQEMEDNSKIGEVSPVTPDIQRVSE
jgi:hypothetical protein